MQTPSRVLVSGATGYVGGRLVPYLLKAGLNVRCMAREPERLDPYPWRGDVEVVQADALDQYSLEKAFEGMDVAYYLIHSLSAGEDDFENLDRKAANNFAEAASSHNLNRVIYLGGIEPSGYFRSKHLESRLETGDCLRQGSVPVTEFRAAVIIGSGSLSFELIRYLTDRVPVMICPRWVDTRTQPIAIRNVLEYLVEALVTPESLGEVIEIGSPDVVTYGDLFMLYARVRGLKRAIINIPFLTPRLSSHWVGLVTPIDSAAARPLIEGLDNEVVVRQGSDIRQHFSVAPMPVEAAIRRAVQRHDSDNVPTVWNTAFSSSFRESIVDKVEFTEGMIREIRSKPVKATPYNAFRVVKSLGGETGWMYADSLWRFRGFLDRLAGGIGYRKGRRHPTEMRQGDRVDFFRVEAIEESDAHKLLRLRAEINVFGKAWLQFEVTSKNNRTHLTQTAFFEPKGLAGLLYWYGLYLPHRFIFSGMIESIAERAAQLKDSKERHTYHSYRHTRHV